MESFIRSKHLLPQAVHPAGQTGREKRPLKNPRKDSITPTCFCPPSTRGTAAGTRASTLRFREALTTFTFIPVGTATGARTLPGWRSSFGVPSQQNFGTDSLPTIALPQTASKHHQFASWYVDAASARVRHFWSEVQESKYSSVGI